MLEIAFFPTGFFRATCTCTHFFTSRVSGRGHIESEPCVFLCVCVCVWALSRLNHLTYDLDFNRKALAFRLVAIARRDGKIVFFKVKQLSQVLRILFCCELVYYRDVMKLLQSQKGYETSTERLWDYQSGHQCFGQQQITCSGPGGEGTRLPIYSSVICNVTADKLADT